MPVMPRPMKKATKLADELIGKPDNRQGPAQVKVQGSVDGGLNRFIDSMYNKPI